MEVSQELASLQKMVEDLTEQLAGKELMIEKLSVDLSEEKK
jgi:hypothetical protein